MERFNPMWLALAAAAAMVLAPATGWAQDGRDVDVEPSVGRDFGEAIEEQARGIGLEVNALGGMQAYTGDAATLVSPGATYGASIGFDTSRRTKVELGYRGAAFATEDGAGGTRAAIVENGGDAIVKIGPETERVQPYAFGGVGLSRLNVTANQFQVATGGTVSDDWLVKVPLGVGVDFRIFEGDRADLMLGARGIYGLVLDDDAFGGVNDVTQQAQLGLQLGARF